MLSAFEAFSKHTAHSELSANPNRPPNGNIPPITTMSLKPPSYYVIYPRPRPHPPTSRPHPPPPPSNTSLPVVPHPEKTNMLVAPSTVSYPTNVTPLTSLLNTDEERLAHASTYPIEACIVQGDSRGGRACDKTQARAQRGIDKRARLRGRGGARHGMQVGLDSGKAR